ncbi:MAG: ABC transporter permease subunit, partial [Novosphingobium sp.]
VEAGAAENRAALIAESAVSLRDAAIGLAFGTIGGIAGALVFSRFRIVERMFLPIALALSTVPLIAFTPLIVLVFGRDLISVAVIAAIVTFFPILVYVAHGLRQAEREVIEVCQSCGATAGFIIRRVQFPYAVPSLMSSLRIAAPLALVGALLAEWLATGNGLGYGILQVGAMSDYSGVWARVALTTALSFSVYWLIGLTERCVMTWYSA